MTTVTARVAPAQASTSKTANFNKEGFDAFIWNKGYRVIKESAIKCPCVSKATNQQSNCKNCGGTGWAFVNAIETRMVLHSMNLSTKFKEWSQENLGTVSISCLADDEISYMDRISVLDGNAIFSEVLFLKNEGAVYYFNTIYDIKEIKYIALFDSTSVAYIPLTYGTDFTYTENEIVFLTASDYVNPLVDPNEQDISITVRYEHAPQFHVLDIPRETIQTTIQLSGTEQVVDMPVHAVGRRSHYVLDRQDYSNTRILRNDRAYVHDQLNPTTPTC